MTRSRIPHPSKKVSIRGIPGKLAIRQGQEAAPRRSTSRQETLHCGNSEAQQECGGAGQAGTNAIGAGDSHPTEEEFRRRTSNDDMNYPNLLPEAAFGEIKRILLFYSRQSSVHSR
jgi:hypothetical protein